MTSIQELKYSNYLARARTDSFLDALDKTREVEEKTAPRHKPIEFPRELTRTSAKPTGAKKRKPPPPPREGIKKPRLFPPPPSPVRKAPTYLEDITFFNKTTTKDGVNLLAINAPFRGRDGMEIVLDGVEYRTEEHAIQASKFLVASRVSASERRSLFLSDVAAMFRGDRFITYKEAAEAGKRIRLYPAEFEAWCEKDVEIQRRICMYKLTQYAEVRNALRCTTGTTIVFSTPYMSEEAFWGMQKTETGRLVGKNMLGIIWMGLRD